MKRRTKILKGIITSVSVVAVVAVIAVAARRGGEAGALSYQEGVDVDFTFNDALNVSLSSADLVIDNLTPGNYADSNEITVSVGTNTLYGYALYATAGNSSYAGSSNFNANDLVLTNGGAVSASQTNKFTSLASNASVASMSSAEPNTWGYAYATYNSGTSTWGSYSNYSGLPVYTEETGAELVSTNESLSSQQVKFKIAAKASEAQIAGEYTNVVNFVAVANPAPKTIANSATMQEVEECPAGLIEGKVFTLKDSRDDRDYKVAKLADGKCWMVENLNLAGGTALSADDTDVTGTYISNFSTSNNLTKVGTDKIQLPASATKNSGDNNLTDSTQFNTDNYSYVFNSGNKANCGASGQNTPCYSYYSWDAATLGSGRTISSDNTDAQQSICPKGWKLPTSRTTSATNWQTTSDFYQLAVAYGMSNSSTSQSTSNFYNQAGPGTTLVFLLAGYYYGSVFDSGGSYGVYWSSTSYSDTRFARYFSFGTSYVDSAGSYYRRRGFSVRCLIGS